MVGLSVGIRVAVGAGPGVGALVGVSVGILGKESVVIPVRADVGPRACW